MAVSVQSANVHVVSEVKSDHPGMMHGLGSFRVCRRLRLSDAELMLSIQFRRSSWNGVYSQEMQK